MILGNRQATHIDEQAAAKYLTYNHSKYDGLTPSDVLNAHKDPAFLESLELSGYGAVHMAEDKAAQERLYVSMCHRHYTLIGKSEVISAQHRHALWVQAENNRRLEEHGAFMHKEAEAIGRIGGFQAGHTQGIEAGKKLKSRPLFDFSGGFGEITGGFVDTFRWIGVVGVVLILAVVYMAYGKGKG
jgi:hypothetical protein